MAAHRPKLTLQLHLRHLESIPENPPYTAVNAYDDDDYEAEFDAAGSLNLGAESPGSILRPITPLTPGFPSSSSLSMTPATAEPDEWSTSALGKSMNTNVPARDRLWRSSSFHKRVVSKKNTVVDDGDCGICFEVAVNPLKTPCCDKTFCKDHLIDWLNGSSSDGRCPSCKSLFPAFSSYTPTQSYPPTPKTPGTPPADQGFIPMTPSSASASSWRRYLPISLPISISMTPINPQSLAPSQLPSRNPSRPSTPSPLSASSSSADFLSSSSSSSVSSSSSATITRPTPLSRSSTSTITSSTSKNPKSHTQTQIQPQPQPKGWQTPEFMGGVAERLLSLVALTLLFYVLSSSKAASASSSSSSQVP